MAMMARSRLPRIVSTLGACTSSLACAGLSQLPRLTPIRFARLTRLMPGAEQPGVSRLVRESPSGVKTQVDGRGR
jgi:hypothetical protein